MAVAYDEWTVISLLVLAIPMTYLILHDRVWGTLASFLIILVWAHIDTARFELSNI